MSNRAYCATLLAGVAVLAVASYPANAQSVTRERLLNSEAEPQNWLLPYGNYEGHSYSRLDQINVGNVAGLHVAYMVGVGGTSPTTAGPNAGPPGGQQRPVVDGGFMYLANGWSQVLKIDLNSGTQGTILWTNDPAQAVSGVPRGAVGLMDDFVVSLTRDGRLLKIDAASGETIWEMNILPEVDPTMNLADGNSTNVLLVNDVAIVPAVRTGKRGWVAARDLESGELVWHFNMIPGPGEFGHETWADDHNAYLTGGAGVWSTPVYDAANNILLVGTAEPGPWGDQAFRPGDNLFSVATVALNADSGELAWYFQEIPNENWDYDSINPRMVYDITVNGETRHVSSNWGRGGFFYTLDAATGEFIHAGQYTPQNWTAGIDSKTGLPMEYNAAVGVQVYAPGKNVIPGDPTSSRNVCPFFIGAPTFFPPTYDPDMQRTWQVAGANCFDQSIPAAIDRTVDWVAGNQFGIGGPGMVWTIVERVGGQIIGVDAVTGEAVQRLATRYVNYAGMLGTAGGLLFTGHPDGTVAAYSKETMEELWSFNTGNQISSAPITFAVDDKQYVAILTGGAATLATYLGETEISLIRRAPQIVVFAL